MNALNVFLIIVFSNWSTAFEYTKFDSEIKPFGNHWILAVKQGPCRKEQYI